MMMAEYTRKEVLDEARHLASMLSNIEEINRFKEVEAKINIIKRSKKIFLALKHYRNKRLTYKLMKKKQHSKKSKLKLTVYKMKLMQYQSYKNLKKFKSSSMTSYNSLRAQLLVKSQIMSLKQPVAIF